MLDQVLNLSGLAVDLGDLLPLAPRIHCNARFMSIIEKRKHAVVIFLRERVVLVVVALAALNRQPQDSLADAVHAVEHRLHPELFGIDAPFLVDHRVPQEPRRGDLVSAGARNQVARDLLDDELVVRKVAVERAGNPIAIEIHLARLVFLVTVRIGIPSGVEPDPSPPFAVMRRIKQPLDLSRMGVACAIGQKRVFLFDRRRQAEKVERDA